MNTSATLNGWVLSVYPDEVDGAVIWLLGEDGRRYRLTHAFETVFYLSGERPRLEGVRLFLAGLGEGIKTAYTRRRDLYKGELEVLEVRVGNPVLQQRLFYRLHKRFNWVDFYDAKIPFPMRYGVAKDIFPMARCAARVDQNLEVIEIQTLDDPWDLEYELPPLRTLVIEPDADPGLSSPACLTIHYGDTVRELPTADAYGLLETLQTILDQYDPDVIFARYGDSWVFPYLLAAAEKYGFDFNPGRDGRQHYKTIKEMTFESYGSVYFRAHQTLLYGRWHIDPRNSTMDMGFNFSMRSAVEMARVTGVDVQTAARNSPGSGFTAMQVKEALRRGILVPLHKYQTEKTKSALMLTAADNGGLNYRPVLGLHKDVAELDFFSMYPSIMAGWNISGETVGVEGGATRFVPDTGMPIRQDQPGLVASVLRPLLAKRRVVKSELRTLTEDDPRRPVLQSISDALKWLGYVSFGYQGYKNNLFGNIQAHEAICAVGRETLVTAIETAHDMGFDVLAANVDSLFVHKDGLCRPEDFQPLIDEIIRRTDLIIEMEGVFAWLAFSRSRQNPRIGAANRYFGKFYGGGMKVRGMAQRRSDTPLWIANAEREIMAFLTDEGQGERLEDKVDGVVGLTRQYFAELDAERVPLPDLVCQAKLSRELGSYRGNSLSAKAAAQLARHGREVRVGQRVPFVYTHGEKSSVYAWEQPGRADYSRINKPRYKELLLRVVYQIVAPLGVEEDAFGVQVEGQARQLRIWPEWEHAERAILSEEEITLADILFAPYASDLG